VTGIVITVALLIQRETVTAFQAPIFCQGSTNRLHCAYPSSPSGRLLLRSRTLWDRSHSALRPEERAVSPTARIKKGVPTSRVRRNGATHSSRIAYANQLTKDPVSVRIP
jgi:hypothetical protein